MIVTTTNTVEGYRIAEYLGVIRGIVVRAPSISQGFSGALQSFTGGDNTAYTEVCDQAREAAYWRMMEHAKKLGADAIVGVRYDATEFMSHTTEVLAYGTAVKLVAVQPASSGDVTYIDT
jgi:uncharacterized protein YbjQ (UPF0145 family)